jgi:hypothetical protein
LNVSGRPNDETTINLKYIRCWSKPIERIVKPFLTSHLVAAIKQIEISQPAECYYDELKNVFSDNNIDLPFFDEWEEDEIIVSFMYKEYKRLIGFHATKLQDVQIPYREGLRTLSCEDYYLLSRDLFNGYATEEKILSVLNDFQDRITNMTIEMGFFREDYDDDNACNYLVFGSETLLVIANHLDEYRCRDILRKRNIPAIYTCSVPLEYVCESDIAGLFKIMFSRYFMKLTHPHIGFGYMYSFTLKKKMVEREYIIGHKIITRKIFDPFDRMCYQYQETDPGSVLS